MEEHILDFMDVNSDFTDEQDMNCAEDESILDEDASDQYVEIDTDENIDAIGVDSNDDEIIDTFGESDTVSDIFGDGIDISGDITHHGYDIDGNGIVSYFEFETNSLHVGSETYYDESNDILYPPVFDVNSGNDGVIGEPASDMEHWHMQTHPDTCAVVSQEYVLEELLGEDFDENNLMDIATENGWYTPGGGTPMENVGDILEHYGLQVERGSGTIEDLEAVLSNGEKVIVGIDSDEIWTNGDDAMADHVLEDIVGIPDADANHAVEVIGIDRSDIENPMVILNDPGHPGGQGAMIPLELFEDSWEDSGNYMVSAIGTTDENHHEFGFTSNVDQISFGGYYNNDGTYHWTSDDSNTDEDGNIVYYS